MIRTYHGRVGSGVLAEGPGRFAQGWLQTEPFALETKLHRTFQSIEATPRQTLLGSTNERNSNETDRRTSSAVAQQFLSCLSTRRKALFVPGCRPVEHRHFSYSHFLTKIYRDKQAWVHSEAPRKQKTAATLLLNCLPYTGQPQIKLSSTAGQQSVKRFDIILDFFNLANPKSRHTTGRAGRGGARRGGGAGRGLVGRDAIWPIWPWDNPLSCLPAKRRKNCRHVSSGTKQV